MAAPPASFVYFATDYFTQFYFPLLEIPAPSGDLPGRFFATTFFTPFYFPPLLPIQPGTPEDLENSYRDADAFFAVATALRATGEFAGVFFGTTVDRRPGGADLSPIAVITPEWWSEHDDADPCLVVRHVVFTLTIVAREDDPVTGFDRLDRLTCVVQNAIEGTDLDGGCLPALTRLCRGNFDVAAVYPEMHVSLLGEFSYLIASPNSHFTSY
jgi:hypothetical protein